MRLLLLAACAAAIVLAGCETDSPLTRALKPLSPQMLAQLEQKHMPIDSPILIRLFKEESEIEVWKQDTSGHFALLKTYPICRWSGELGPNVREGDRQARHRRDVDSDRMNRTRGGVFRRLKKRRTKLRPKSGSFALKLAVFITPANSMNLKPWRTNYVTNARALGMARGKYINSTRHSAAERMSRKACGNFTRAFTKIGTRPSRVQSRDTWLTQTSLPITRGTLVEAASPTR